MNYERNLNEYIVGFVDGEGSFSWYSWKYINGIRKKPLFVLMNTNKEILILVKNHLKLDTEISLKKRYEDDRGDSLAKKPIYCLKASGFSDIEKLVSFFDEHPPIVKLREYRHFKKLFAKWQKRYIPPQRHSPDLVAKVRQLYLQELPFKEIARLTQVPIGTLGRYVKDIRCRYKKTKQK